jgi:hypothetical protein
MRRNRGNREGAAGFCFLRCLCFLLLKLFRVCLPRRFDVPPRRICDLVPTDRFKDRSIAPQLPSAARDARRDDARLQPHPKNRIEKKVAKATKEEGASLCFVAFPPQADFADSTVTFC